MVVEVRANVSRLFNLDPWNLSRDVRLGIWHEKTARPGVGWSTCRNCRVSAL